MLGLPASENAGKARGLSPITIVPYYCSLLFFFFAFSFSPLNSLID